MDLGRTLIAQRPQDLVFTLFGEYLLAHAEPVWVGSLISLLEPFGLTEGGVRTVLSRMTKKGWLRGERVGRNAFYELTPRGRKLLREGQARIFHPRWNDEWDGTWFLLAYSIPQDARHLRDRLRDRLGWLGFGSIGNGLWVSPHDVSREVEELSDALGLGEHLLCFRATRSGTESPGDLVARGWDLEALDRQYRDFIAQWEPVLAELTRHPPEPGEPSETSFARRFRLIHEFRRFPLLDPYLPRELLPAEWGGDEATRVFRALHDHLVGPADAWVDHVLADAPAPAPSA